MEAEARGGAPAIGMAFATKCVTNATTAVATQKAHKARLGLIEGGYGKELLPLRLGLLLLLVTAVRSRSEPDV